METILEAFFEHFETLERNALHARYKRQSMVEYFNTLIEGCRMGLGQSLESQTVIQTTITYIVRQHRIWMTKNSGVCMMGKYHNVLYIALKLAYDWQLRDSATVGALLDEIYTCERSFERLFVGALFGTRAPHFVAGWKSDFGDQEENLRAAVFYLQHSVNARSEFAGSRLVDVPLDCCGGSSCVKVIVQLGAPDKLLIFLRHGARADGVCDVILRMLTDAKNHCYPFNQISCLQMLLRVLPQVQLETRNLPSLKDDVFDQYSDLVVDGILPISRCGLLPPELKHLCRCAIRDRLWLNHHLTPSGIRALPVPEILHRYLDIMED